MEYARIITYKMILFLNLKGQVGKYRDKKNKTLEIQEKKRILPNQVGFLITSPIIIASQIILF